MQLFMSNLLSLDKTKMTVDSILDGSIALPSEPFCPADVLAAVKTMAKGSGKPGIAFEVESGATEMTLVGAPLQINLMLLNLVSNAAKFTTSGKLVLSSSVVQETATSVEIKFAVTDTGPGIPENKQQGILDLRSQTGSSESQSKGFGIGLNVTSNLAKIMGGALDVRSPVRDGKGSEFGFTLKLEKVKEAVAGVAAKEIGEQPVDTTFTVQSYSCSSFRSVVQL